MNTPLCEINGLEIGLERPTRVMGVINLSPESFYEGSIAVDTESIIRLVKRIEQEGADLIDVGAASTSPKSIYSRSDTSVDEECERIEQFMGCIVENTSLVVSIDTVSARVATLALDLGASMVNDISGFHADPNMAHLVAERNVPVVLMASCKKPCVSVQQSMDALVDSLRIADESGVDCNRIIIDPGIGFGKPTETDIALIRQIRRFSLLGHVILVGVSRKAFIGDLLEQPDPGNRLPGTIAATSIAVANGASIIRAHDVKEAVSAAKIGAILRGPEPLVDHNITFFGICDQGETRALIDRIGVGEKIRSALSRKGFILNVLVRTLRVPSALIIKQEMLSLGGDAAYHHGTIDSEVEKTDVLIMGTPFQLERLCEKLTTMEYFGLSEIGNGIQNLLHKYLNPNR